MFMSRSHRHLNTTISLEKTRNMSINRVTGNEITSLGRTFTYQANFHAYKLLVNQSCPT